MTTDGQPPGSASSASTDSSVKRFRRFVYGLFHTINIETRPQKTVRLSMEVLIVVNVILVITETVPSAALKYGHVFYIIDVISAIVFSLEYLLRMWSIVEGDTGGRPNWKVRARYAVSLWAIIDLLAIVPFFIHLFAITDLRIVRALRLFRLERIFTIGRYSEPFQKMGSILRSKRKDLLAAFAVSGVVLLMASSIMYFAEHEAQPDKFPDIPSSLWWGVVTLTSVGYGDIYPITTIGKIFGGMIAVMAIAVVSIPSGIIVTGYLELAQEKTAAKFCPHCGMSLQVQHRHIPDDG